MSTVQKDCYVVNVHGQYFADTGERKELRAYKGTFFLPDAKRPLGIIKGKLLMPFLQKRDSQAYALYSHHIDEIIPPGGKPFDPDDIPYRFQTKEQLRIYVKRHKLPINVDEYGKLGLLRDHVRLAKEEPENFLMITARHKARKEEDDKLAELNKDFADGQVGMEIPLAEGGGAGIVDKSTPAPERKTKTKVDDNTPEDKDFLT